MRDLQQDGAMVRAHLDALAKGAPVADAFAPDAQAWLPHPWHGARGHAALSAFYAALTDALPDAEWRPEIVLAGENHPDARTQETRYSPLVGALGHWQGTFTRPLLGIPPTGGVVHLRICEVHHLNSDGCIAHSWILPDLIDLMDQAGCYPLPPMKGARGMWPGPRGGGGIRSGPVDAAGGARAMAQVLDMHQALGIGADISNVPMHHWHPDFMYYAAAGIGMCRGVEGFRRNHQAPFRSALPDRRSRGHFVRIADGDFALTGGLLYATHTGEYLGIPATGRAVSFMVMDFYHFDSDGLIAENWLPFDILGLAHQLGVDLLPGP
ncbi:ester cyclase [Hasllibacter sp. MH4015]|uniref:ester cyclase n=1 Tax=Hasllibacter sp. MH4015 TaxID=2854029 RepID=UPI001CD2F387|nr:ester cyclase [Hasllibacter sp. MH4015]